MQYIIVMSIFFALIILSGIFLDRVVNNYASKIISVLFVIGYLILVYIRPYFFRDTYYYEMVYNRPTWELLHNINLLAKEPITKMEYGFLLIMNLFRSINVSFRLFSVLLSLFMVIVFYKFSQYLSRKINGLNFFDSRFNHFPLFFGIYISYIGTFYSFVAIRSGLSLAILLIASYYAMEKKFVRTVIAFIIAFSIQRFAILIVVPIIIILFWDKKLEQKRFKYVWIVLGALIIASYFFQNFVFSRIWERTSLVLSGFYDLNTDKQQNTSITRLIHYISYWISGYLIYKEKSKDTLSNKISIIYIIGLGMCVLFSGYTSAYRIIDYMYMFMIPLSFSVFFNWNGNSLTKKMVYSSNFILFLLVISRYVTNWFMNDTW